MFRRKSKNEFVKNSQERHNGSRDIKRQFGNAISLTTITRKRKLRLDY